MAHFKPHPLTVKQLGHLKMIMDYWNIFYPEYGLASFMHTLYMCQLRNNMNL